MGALPGVVIPGASHMGADPMCSRTTEVVERASERPADGLLQFIKSRTLTVTCPHQTQ